MTFGECAHVFNIALVIISSLVLGSGLSNKLQPFKKQSSNDILPQQLVDAGRAGNFSFREDKRPVAFLQAHREKPGHVHALLARELAERTGNLVAQDGHKRHLGGHTLGTNSGQAKDIDDLCGSTCAAIIPATIPKAACGSITWAMGCGSKQPPDPFMPDSNLGELCPESCEVGIHRSGGAAQREFDSAPQKHQGVPGNDGNSAGLASDTASGTASVSIFSNGELDGSEVEAGSVDSVVPNETLFELPFSEYNEDDEEDVEMAYQNQMAAARSRGTQVVYIQMQDDSGNGWEGARYTIRDPCGSVIATGDMEFGSSRIVMIEIPDHCVETTTTTTTTTTLMTYTINVSPGEKPWEIHWSVLTPDCIVIQGDGPTEGADPFDSRCVASLNMLLQGVTEAGRNYATRDTLAHIRMLDDGGDGWNGAYYTVKDSEGGTLAYGTMEAGDQQVQAFWLPPSPIDTTTTTTQPQGAQPLPVAPAPAPSSEPNPSPSSGPNPSPSGTDRKSVV